MQLSHNNVDYFLCYLIIIILNNAGEKFLDPVLKTCCQKSNIFSLFS